jgi:hypothetical protein
MADALPPLPDQIRIPDLLVEEWAALPSNHVVTMPITKAVIDHLFFAMVKTLSAQDFMQACVIHISNGRTDEGNKALNGSQREVIEASNRLRQFMTEIMLAATRGSPRE